MEDMTNYIDVLTQIFRLYDNQETLKVVEQNLSTYITTVAKMINKCRELDSLVSHIANRTYPEVPNSITVSTLGILANYEEDLCRDFIVTAQSDVNSAILIFNKSMEPIRLYYIIALCVHSFILDNLDH